MGTPRSADRLPFIGQHGCKIIASRGTDASGIETSERETTFNILYLKIWQVDENTPELSILAVKLSSIQISLSFSTCFFCWCNFVIPFFLSLPSDHKLNNQQPSSFHAISESIPTANLGIPLTCIASPWYVTKKRKTQQHQKFSLSKFKLKHTFVPPPHMRDVNFQGGLKLHCFILVANCTLMYLLISGGKVFPTAEYKRFEAKDFRWRLSPSRSLPSIIPQPAPHPDRPDQVWMEKIKNVKSCLSFSTQFQEIFVL